MTGCEDAAGSVPVAAAPAQRAFEIARPTCRVPSCIRAPPPPQSFYVQVCADVVGFVYLRPLTAALALAGVEIPAALRTASFGLRWDGGGGVCVLYQCV